MLTSRWLNVGLALCIIVLAPVHLRADAVPLLRVGTAPNFQPIAFLEKGELRGLEIDFARRLGKELDRRIEFVQLEWDDTIPALLDRRVDVVMAGMSITPERQKRVRFTRPYFESSQMVLIRAEDSAKLKKTGALNDGSRTVGFEGKTTGEAYVRAQLPLAKSQPFGSIEEGVAALRARRIDALVHDAATVWRIMGRFEDEKELTSFYTRLTSERLAWAVRPGEDALLTELNAALERWERSGWLDLALGSWIPVRRIQIQ